MTLPLTGAGLASPRKVLLLDALSANAISAHSPWRYLTTSYEGQPVLRLRADDGGSTEQDFKLVAGTLVTDDATQNTVAAWLTGLSASNAFLHTRYDQSGNGNDSVQATAAAQALYVASAINGKPAFLYDGTDDVDAVGTIFNFDSASGGVTILPVAQDDNFLGDDGSVGTRRFRIGEAGSTWKFQAGASVNVVSDNPGVLYPAVVTVRTGSDVAAAWNNRHAHDPLALSGTGTAVGFQYGAVSTSFGNSYIAEGIWFNSTISDTDRAALERSMLDEAQIYYNEDEVDIQTSLNQADVFDKADVTGNGLDDFLVGLENGEVYWFEQTTRNAFTQHTVRGTSVAGGTLEGGMWADIDGDGNYEIVALDQAQGEVRVYKQDTVGSPTGTWSGGVIQTGRIGLQDCMFANVGDARSAIIYTWEGNNSALEGGVHRLLYDGSGDVTASGNYADHLMIQESGAWWIAPGLRDLGSGEATEIAFSVRRDNLSASVAPGLYYLTKTATITDPWTETQIYTADADWLHCDWGDFFGNGVTTDLVLNSLQGNIEIFDFSSAWARTNILTTSTAKAKFAVWNAGMAQKNAHDLIFAIGTNTNSTWENIGGTYAETRQWISPGQKKDDRTFFVTIGNDVHVYAVDSFLDKFTRFEISNGAL